ncbi:DedA family protein [Actinomycetospora lutea]|uniref:DedA family protein n=1 Tax=Actinomycetospora lutea TaxID=663604 RepID=UPI0023669697|nr:DedA family protein [Actinomycetospora lutea]MDD7939783.1 DedA family protein [Actinomycetospora lutea]
MTGAGTGTDRDDLTGPADDTGPETTGPGKKRFRWRSKDFTPEEHEEAREALRKVKPWDGPMARADKFIVVATLGIIALNLASMPFRPFLLASHPIGLAAVTGSLSAVGAGAAFAAIGQGPLWLVIVAGVFGMIKFDWLFWLAGRRWGAKIVQMWAPGDVAQRFVGWVQGAPRWVLGLAVILSALPGIPAPAVFALAGMGRMRLVPFLVLDAIGAALIAGLVAGLGYGVGQHAVDLVLTIDKYALWITLGLIVVVSVRASMKAQKEQKAKKAGQAAS